MYRLKQKYVPTPLVRENEREPVPIVPFQKPRSRRLSIPLRLLVWIAQMLWVWVTTRDPTTRAIRMGTLTRTFLERVGYLWIKFGQLVSVREDLLPRAFCAELTKLQWQATGFPPALAREVIERELGGPVERFFDRFEDTPLAAASIAQVHRACLKDRTEVVVKVMRPGSDEVFLDDMAFLSAVASLMARFNVLEWIRLDEVIWELDQMMREEVDFRYELNNLKVMRKQLRQHKVYIPKPYGRFSTQRVLVMEYVPGVLMSDLIRIRNEDEARATSWLRENSIRPKRMGRKLYLSFLRQVFEENRFHGDLHPGNIMLLRNSRFAFIDLGTISSIERTVLQKYVLMSKAIAQHEYDRAVDLVFGLVPELPAVNVEDLRQDMIRSLRAWAIRTPIKDIPYKEKSLMQGLLDVMRILAQERIVLTWSFLRIVRSRGNMDSTLSYLAPSMDQPKLYRRYFRGRERRVWREILRPRSIRRILLSATEMISELDVFLGPVIRRMSRMFRGSTDKLDDVLQAILGLIGKGLAVGTASLALLYVHAYHAQLLGRLPPVLRLTNRMPVFLAVSGWMSGIAGGVWIAVMLAGLYLWLAVVRPMAQRVGEAAPRLPDADRA